MKLILENWREYLDKLTILDEKLNDQVYITKVLGIQIPLNESYPYSTELKEKIIKEHMLFEGFWGDLGDKIKQGAVATWDKAKQLPKQAAEMFIMLYKIVTDQAKRHTFDKAIHRQGLAKYEKKINNFLDLIATKLANEVPTLAKWAKKIRSILAKPLSEQLKSGAAGGTAMQALAKIARLVGLTYIWSKIGKIIEGVLKETDSNAQLALLKNFAQEKADDFLADTIIKITSGFRAAIGDITIFWDWLKKIGGGMKLVFDALSPTLAQFKGRGGLNETTI